MGYPRRVLVPPDTPGVFHCVSRCVRRAFLCGVDPLTGHSFEHRKQWLEDRILELSQCFAVAVHAYAVMDNHVHLVLDVDPRAPRGWSDEAVARRWLRLFGPRKRDNSDLAQHVDTLCQDLARLAVVRQRLGSLSWFMRCLKEPIARRANREDGCTGRFWEGRFKCQTLLDEAALLACMTYVDLNPVRAGLAESPENSAHTSLRIRAGDHDLNAPLSCIAGTLASHRLPVSTAHYLALVDWTGRALHRQSKGAVANHFPPILQRLNLQPSQWLAQVPATESHYWRAIGTAQSLLHHTQTIGQRWLRGITFARFLAASAPG